MTDHRASDSVPGLPSVDPFYLKKVFVWVPEYTWDEIEYIPCPHCGGHAQLEWVEYGSTPSLFGRRCLLHDRIQVKLPHCCNCCWFGLRVDVAVEQRDRLWLVSASRCRHVRIISLHTFS